MEKKGKKKKNRHRNTQLPANQQQQEQQCQPQQQQSGPQQQQQQSGPQQQQQQSGPQQQQQQGKWQHGSQKQPPGPQQQRSTSQEQQRGSQKQPPGPQQQPSSSQEQPFGPEQQQQQGKWQRGSQKQTPGPQQQPSSSQEQPFGPEQQQQQGKWQRGSQKQAPGPQQQPSSSQEQPFGPEQQQQQGKWQRGSQKQPPGPQQQPSSSQEQRFGPEQQQQQGKWQRGSRKQPPGPQQQPSSSQEQPFGPEQQQQQGKWQRGSQKQAPGPQQQQSSSQEQPFGPEQQQQQGKWQRGSQKQPPGPQQQPTTSLEQQRGSPKQPSESPKQTAMVLQRFSKKSSLPMFLHMSYLEKIPVKDTRGSQGRKITVETNMLRVLFPQNFAKTIIHYDVNIIPDRPKSLLRSVFEQFKKEHCPGRHAVFDGRRNAYSAGKLPFGDQSPVAEITIFDHEFAKERNFNIYLKNVAVLDLSWLVEKKYDLFESGDKERCIQALDIILRHDAANRYPVAGKSIFMPPTPGKVVSLSSGMDVWVGLFQSLIIGSRPYLNIDVAHKGFPTPQPVVDLMKELSQNSRNYEQSGSVNAQNINYNFAKINNFLKGLKIQYELPEQPTSKRTYRVNGLVSCARENKFSLEDQTVCTVEQYFSQRKGYRIRHPDIPCLWVGSRNSNIHLPAELCTIVAGQVTQKKLDEVQVSKMIREASTDTQKRKAKILNHFAEINLNQQPTLLNEFHFSVHGEFENVPARVLQAPALRYDQKQVNVFKGTWKPEKFLKPCNLPENTWTILNLDTCMSDPALYNLHQNLQNGGKLLNMKIDKALTPFVYLTVQRNIKNISQYFEEKKRQNIKLVVVILPNLNNAYSIVKQISELQIQGGIVTQCIKSQTVRKLNNSTVVNILLKINSKLNGVNHTLVERPLCLNVPCMIVGADVTHPSPDVINIPSIAAVAASHDPSAFQFNIEVRLQSPREEIIQDLQEIMMIQLKFFFTKTRYKPKKIIFYRDGVSEGQLTQVMHYELSAIKKAIMKLENSSECNIPITFFVVQKRHHVRFFPTSAKNSDDRNFNVQAGTIVDTEITHPTHIDFYLVSHASIQGTARPTKYRCICNENMMSEDEIEQLTYYLCHMFARCTRSVSYPAPTYYAHLAAFRARALIQNVTLNMDNLKEEQRRKMTLQINKDSPMFFV